MAMRDYEGLVKNLRKMQSVNYCAIASAEGFPAIRIVQDAANAIEELCKQLASCSKSVASCSKSVASCSKWISVEERPPKPDADVLAYCEWVGMSGTTYHEIQLTSLKELRNQGYRPVAWMPLPEPPKEGKP